MQPRMPIYKYPHCWNALTNIATSYGVHVMFFVLHQLPGHGSSAISAEGNIGDSSSNSGDGGVASDVPQDSIGILDLLEDLKVIVVLLLRFSGVLTARCFECFFTGYLE